MNRRHRPTAGLTLTGGLIVLLPTSVLWPLQLLQVQLQLLMLVIKHQLQQVNPISLNLQPLELGLNPPAAVGHLSRYHP